MKPMVTIEVANDSAKYIVKEANAKGEVHTESYDAVEALAHDKVVQTLINKAKTGQTLRAALHTLLGEIFVNPTLAAYAGKSDAKTNKVDAMLKKALINAEIKYFETAEKKGELKAVLPAKSDNPDKDFQAFVDEITTDNNYKNIRSLCLQHFAFCGMMPVTKSKYLVPPPIMAARVKAMKDTSPPDNSIAAQLGRVLENAKALKEKFGMTDVTKALLISRELTAYIKAAADRYAEIATAAAQHLAPDGSVIEAANTVIKGAQTVPQSKEVEQV